MTFSNRNDITEEFQHEVDRLAAAGGGEVVFGPGVYHFRTVRLRSNLCVTLQAGARLVASPRREDYSPIGYHHNEMGEVYSALFAFDEQNLTLRGEGTLGLSGLAFYHLDRPSPVTTVGPEVTQAYLDEAPRTYDWRVNQPVVFHRCRHLRLEGLTITNAPCCPTTTACTSPAAGAF